MPASPPQKPPQHDLNSVWLASSKCDTCLGNISSFNQRRYYFSVSVPLCPQAAKDPDRGLLGGKRQSYVVSTGMVAFQKVEWLKFQWTGQIPDHKSFAELLFYIFMCTEYALNLKLGPALICKKIQEHKNLQLEVTPSSSWSGPAGLRR